MVNIKTHHCIFRSMYFLVNSKGKSCEAAGSEEEFGFEQTKNRQISDAYTLLII